MTPKIPGSAVVVTLSHRLPIDQPIDRSQNLRYGFIDLQWDLVVEIEAGQDLQKIYPGESGYCVDEQAPEFCRLDSRVL